MVFAAGILLVGLMTHERIRLRPRASSSSSSSLPPVVGDNLEEVVALSLSSSSSSSGGAVVVARLDAQGRPCRCVTCTPPPPLSPNPASADDVYVDMTGGDVPAPFYVDMGGGDVAAPSSFAVSDAAVDPVVVADDSDIV